MTVQVYLGERYEHTHENQAFDRLCQIVEEFWGNQEQEITLIGNVTCNGHELDALLIKPDSITVIDFKNFGGCVIFNENGPWYADGKEVKGGAKVNPFKQIHANKFALLNWLQVKLPNLAESNNLGHISGLVLFQKEIYFDHGQLPANIASWFSVGDFSTGFDWLTHLASPSINITRNQQKQLVQALNLSVYEAPSRNIKSTQLISEPVVNHELSLQLTLDQQEALRLVEQLLNSDTQKALLLSGMVSTGKTTLISKIGEIVSQAELKLVCLAPNAVFANSLEFQTNTEFLSIYGHIYNQSAVQEDETSELIVRPLRKCADAPNTIYLIDEAQQLSDSYFELETERFGSGHTFTDFLEFSQLSSTEKRLIVLGDPYQIERGQSILDPQFYIDKKIEVLHKELMQLIEPDGENPNLDTAITLVKAIKSKVFNQLDIQQQAPSLHILSDHIETRTSYYQNVFQDQSGCSVFLTYAHGRVNQVNEWGRKRFLSFSGRLPKVGDRVELRNKVSVSKSGLETEHFYPGSWATVLACMPSVIDKSITLKGRQGATRLIFNEIEVRFNGAASEYKLLYLQDYLLAEKPELDKDTLLALRIVAEQNIKSSLKDESDTVAELRETYQETKSSEDKEKLTQARANLNQKKKILLEQDRFWNAARLRYAYARTVHHAQGVRWDDVLIDASYNGQSRNNEGYFRWLYTAITRARNQVQLDKFIPITPLDKLELKTHRVVITDSIKSLFQLPYDKERQPSELERSYPYPEGLASTKPELISLWLYIRERLEKHSLKITAIKQNAYQEQYTVANAQDEQAVIILHYNGKLDVTRLRAQTSTVLAKEAIAALQEPLSFLEPLAQQVLQTISAVFKQESIFIEGGKSSNWQLILTLSNSEQQHAILKVYYGKNGSISTLEVEKATHEDIVEQLRIIFTVNKEA